MRDIKQATDVIRNNLHEAREYIAQAYRLRDASRPMADWCKDMAAGHMAFNAKGHAVVEQMIKAIPADESPLTPGMKAVYEAIHGDLIAEAAEIKAMIDTYK